MSRLLATLIAAATMTVSTSLFAFDGHHNGHANQHGHHHNSHGQSRWNHPVHTPDLIALDQLSDRLERIAEHLHEDAHQLSQDYHHSASIERYVDQVDRLQKHMHGILHRQAQSGFSSYDLIRHIKSDVRQTKDLFNRLYGEIQHQGYDGARQSDFRLMAHMRRIIAGEAFPLVRSMESELYGYNRIVHTNHSNHSYQQPIRTRTRSRGWPSFRFSF